MKPTPIKLTDFLTLEDADKTKVKFNMNPGNPNLRAWDLLRDDDPEWLRMNAWRKRKDPNNNLEHTTRLLAFAQYYPYGPEYYIFGGLYRVSVAEPGAYDAPGYRLELEDRYREYAKRLIVKLKQPVGRNLYLRWLTNLDGSLGPEVYEIRPASKLAAFPGYSNVRLSHAQLKRILEREEPEWRQALSAVKAVYVITDRNTGKLYVGSACGNAEGLWQRWSTYANPNNLTGGNKELERLKEELGTEYIESYFQYSILEIFDPKTRDYAVIERESFWKEVFQSKRFGYNAN